jgi:hypothetical protein
MHLSTDKDYTIYLIEENYCNRLEVLVEKEFFDDAHSLFEEFVINSEEPEEWLFIPYFKNVC